MQTNTQKRPSFSLPQKLSLPKIETFTLEGGDLLHVLPSKTTSLIQLEIKFEAGSWYQSYPFEAVITGKMLSEGTKTYNSKTIAETIDFYGGYYAIGVDKDFSSIQFVFPKMYLKEILPILSEMIYHSIFPSRELEIIEKNLIQSIKQDNQQGDIIANKQLLSMIFGADHPYGRIGQPEEVDLVTKENLEQFYTKRYRSTLSQIFIAGNVNESDIQLMEKYLSIKRTIENEEEKRKDVSKSKLSKINITRKESTQSSIRMGKLLFNNSHPDYIPLHIANTVLGGYFGSRLMNNLREQKGYTYGIGSYMLSFKHAGIFGISTEVGIEHTEMAVEEIYKEINALSSDEIDKKELDRVKNYMIGTYLKSLDGPFNIMNQYATIITKGLSINYPQHYLDEVNSISPNRIKSLMNQYINPESLSLVIVNNREQ